MKRGAEKQISKDDRSDGEEQDENPQVGFRKADESVLAARKIRGLPKRASVASIPAPAPQTGTTGTQKFNGFSGFANSSSFSAFSPTTTSTTTSGTNLFPSSTPSLFPSSPAATSTAKSLTSLLASSPNPPAPLTPPSGSPFTKPAAASLSAPSPAATPASTQKNSAVDPTEFKYYTSLRGLNESLRTAVGKAIDDDPFTDVTVFLERYKSLRADIQKDFNDKATSSAMHSATSIPSSVTNTFSMPAPPSGGFTFAGAKTTFPTDTKPTTTAAPGSGFTPSAPIPSGGFTFGGESKPTKPSVFGAARSMSKKQEPPTSTLPFPFGSKPSEEKKGTSISFPIFGSKPTEDNKELALSTTSTSLTSSNTVPKPSSSLWVTKPDSSSTLSISDKDKADEKPKLLTFGYSSIATTPASSFTFGVTSTSAPALNTSSNTPPSRFAGFGGFGKPTTTATSSFGFSPTLTTPTPPLAITTSGSSVGADTASNSSGDAAADDVPKKNAAESFALNADNKHDQEGAGEEDEETMHAVKLKAYALKDDKGTKNWVEMGYGVLRIKKHKETGLQRVLLRSSSTGQILINFTFHSALKPAQKGKNVTFLGHDAEGISKMYNLKTQTEAQALELKATLIREIDAKE